MKKNDKRLICRIIIIISITSVSILVCGLLAKKEFFNEGSYDVYTNCRDIPIVGIEHWDVVDFLLPMTLSLFRGEEKKQTKPIYEATMEGIKAHESQKGIIKLI